MKKLVTTGFAAMAVLFACAAFSAGNADQEAYRLAYTSFSQSVDLNWY